VLNVLFFFLLSLPTFVHRNRYVIGFLYCIIVKDFFSKFFIIGCSERRNKGIDVTAMLLGFHHIIAKLRDKDQFIQ